MPVSITLEEYWEYRNGYVGFCTTCLEWTADCVEPDAHEYECPACGEPTVYGAEEAHMQEIVEVVE